LNGGRIFSRATARGDRSPDQASVVAFSQSQLAVVIHLFQREGDLESKKIDDGDESHSPFLGCDRLATRKVKQDSTTRSSGNFFDVFD
jgi:hypothetical protein